MLQTTWMKKGLLWASGAQPKEQPRVFYSFLALLLLLTSYYLVKPLRASYFLKEFDPTLLPYFFLALPVLSLLVTRLFNFFYGRVGRFQLIWWTYAVVIACKLTFLVLLPHGGRWLTLIFYYWSAVYFLLSISILWACISTIFNSEAGERTFAFIAFGGMAGALVGSRLSEWLARSAYKNWTLLAAALAMGLVLLFLSLAVRETPDFHDRSESIRHNQTRRRFWQDFVAIWNHRYVRAIAVMVFALAFMNTVVEFKTQKVIDRQLARRQYQTDFAALNQQLCAGTEAQRCHPVHPEAFETIYELKQKPDSERQASLTQWLQAQHLKLDPAEQFQHYQHYHEFLENRTRALFSRINFWINLIGILLLLLAARPLFHSVGVNRVILLLPLFFLLVGALLLFPLELGLTSGILIGTGTLNYSLNKTSKELLYTQSDDEARFKFKPLIEGPIMRLGDVSAAAFKIFCLQLLHFSETQAEWLLLALGMLVTLYWLWSMFFAGSEYHRRKAESEMPEGAVSA